MTKPKTKDRFVAPNRAQVRRRYKEAIHAAVCANGDRDYYTGEPLDWSIISKWRNADSTTGKKKYKKQFAQLPTVDHTIDEQGRLKFVICSWQVNDAKGDLSLEEFYALCESVLRHRESERCAERTITNLEK